MRGLRRECREAGWSFRLTSKGHEQWVPPKGQGPILVLAGTAGDWRAERNFISQVRSILDK